MKKFASIILIVFLMLVYSLPVQLNAQPVITAPARVNPADLPDQYFIISTLRPVPKQQVKAEYKFKIGHGDKHFEMRLNEYSYYIGSESDPAYAVKDLDNDKSGNYITGQWIFNMPNDEGSYSLRVYGAQPGTANGTLYGNKIHIYTRDGEGYIIDAGFYAYGYDEYSDCVIFFEPIYSVDDFALLFETGGIYCARIVSTLTGPSSPRPGDTVTINYTNASTDDEKWIAMIREGDPLDKAHILQSNGLDSAVSGQTTFQLPKTPGVFKIYLFLNSNWEVTGEYTISTFWPGAGFNQITNTVVSPYSYNSVSYFHAPPEINAWIGIFPAEGSSTDNTEYWVSLQGKTDGSVKVSAPGTEGRYVYKMFDSYNNVVAVSDVFEVKGTDPSTVSKGSLKAAAEKDGIRLQWSYTLLSIPSGSWEKGYNVYRSQIQGSGYTLLNTSPVPIAEYLDKTVMEESKYYYIVKPVFSDNSEGTATNEVTVISLKSQNTSSPITGVVTTPLIVGTQTGATVVGTPAGNEILSATPGDGSITLDWKEAADKTGLDGYYLYKGTAPGGEGASPMFDFPVKALTYTDTLVTNGTTYYYIMKPCYDGGSRFGAASNEVSATPVANNTGTIVLTIGSPNMTVNGQSQEIDPGKGTAPVIHSASGRTFVPIRAIVEAMGGTIAWNADEKKVTIVLKDQSVELWIAKTAAKVNGMDKTLDIAPYISDTGRTMLPLRFVTENLGCDVVWDGPNKKITIKYDTGTAQQTNNTGQTLIQPVTQVVVLPVSSFKWTGTWDTDWKEMVFNQTGDKVTGTYDSQKGTIEGTVNGNVLTGTFKEFGAEGDIILTMSGDGKAFNGKWYLKDVKNASVDGYDIVGTRK